MSSAALALMLLSQSPQSPPPTRPVVDLDTERVRPAFGADAYVTHPGVWFDRPGLELGTVLQFEHAPLVAVRSGGRIPIVEYRWSVAAGATWIPTPQLAIMGSAAVHISAGRLQREAPIFALGDASLAASWQIVRIGPFAATMGGELWVPLSPAGALVGEHWRGGPNAAVGLQLGRFEALLALDALVRRTVDTGTGLIVGSEASLTTAVATRWRQHRVFMELRATASIDGTSDGAQPIDVRVGVRLHGGPGDNTLFAIGAGLNDGYGASSFRVLLGVDLSLSDDPNEPDEEYEDEEEPTPAPRGPVTRARVAREPVEEQEVEPIYVPAAPLDPHGLCPRLGPAVTFAVDSTQLTDASRAQLDELAAFMRERPAIAHAIIDGHASPEGKGRANWELSLARAEAVLAYLLSVGVSIHRMSIRGWGESFSADTPAIEDDRRVQLCVIRVLDLLEEAPDWPAHQAPEPWVLP